MLNTVLIPLKWVMTNLYGLVASDRYITLINTVATIVIRMLNLLVTNQLFID